MSYRLFFVLLPQNLSQMIDKINALRAELEAAVAEDAAAVRAEKTAKSAEADANVLRKAAEKRLDAAAEFIVGRVVKH